MVGEKLWEKDLNKACVREMPGLGDAAMTGICWSQDPSISMRSRIDTEGEWAAHRFVINSESVFDNRADRDSWTDVSTSVYEVLEGIWARETF